MRYCVVNENESEREKKGREKKTKRGEGNEGWTTTYEDFHFWYDIVTHPLDLSLFLVSFYI